MRDPKRVPFLILAALAAAGAQDRTAWLPLFDGGDLSQWSYAREFWRSDSGMLIGQGKSSTSTFCHTSRAYSDFVLSGWTRLWETSAGQANSGIQYRSRFTDSLAHRMQGYQWDIGGGFDGSILPEGGFPADAPPREVSEACRATIRKNGWNHVVITADKGHIRHQLNGVTCLEFQASVAAGYFGLQFPATPLVMKVDFRDIFIRPLNGSFAIPDSLAVWMDGSNAVPLGLRPESRVPKAAPGGFGVTFPMGYPAWGRRADALGRRVPLRAGDGRIGSGGR